MCWVRTQVVGGWLPGDQKQKLANVGAVGGGDVLGDEGKADETHRPRTGPVGVQDVHGKIP